MFEKSRKTNRILFLLLITLITGIAYGIGISRLSFYGDDWIYIYNYHIAGSRSFTLFTQWDRPYSAWIYILSSALFGESALPWHIFVFILRWLSTALFWSVMRETFGDRRPVAIAALLFSVYPGFQQQPIAVEFVMHFSSLVLVLLSLRLMQEAYSQTRWKRFLLLAVSLAAGTLSIFTCEYFIGLELSRPFILFFTARRKEPDRPVRENVKACVFFLIPYLCAATFYFIWRIFIFSFQTYGPKLLTSLKENPVSGIRLLAEKVLGDLSVVLLSAYRQVFSRPSFTPILTAALILLAVSAGTFLFLQHSPKHEVSKTDVFSSKELLIFGIILLMLSGIPWWGTFLDVTVSFPWDRSTLSFSPGAAVILAALLDIVLKPVFCCLAAALLTALCALFHLQNTQVYISEADKMNDYFWQLAWRVPGLEEGAILVSDEIPLDRTSDNDLSPVVNWQYAPENRGFTYAYKYFDLDLREGFYYTDPGTAVRVDHTYRTHSFSSTTEKTLGIFYRKHGCLQIVDRANTAYPGLPDSLKRTAGLSDPELILTGSAQALPPAAIGPEPEYAYCYYFQKTSLAQQIGDQEGAYAFALEAYSSDLHPVYASDLAPLLLAFLEANDYEHAEAMMSANEIGSQDREYFCSYWLNLLPADPANPERSDFYKSHGCL